MYPIEQGHLLVYSDPQTTPPSIQPRGAPDLCPVPLHRLSLAKESAGPTGQTLMQGPCCPPDPRINCPNGPNPIPGLCGASCGLVLWKFLGHSGGSWASSPRCLSASCETLWLCCGAGGKSQGLGGSPHAHPHSRAELQGVREFWILILTF